MKPLRILQLSDCHLMPETSALFRGVDSEASLIAIIKAIKEQAIPLDLVLLSGDLLHHDATAARYEKLLDIVAPLDTPLQWLPGNHDDKTIMSQLQPTLFNPCLDLGAWRIISLDTTDEPDGKGAGSLSEDSLRQLKVLLSERPQKPCLIAMHHNPLPTGVDWQDASMLHNHVAFWSTLLPYSQVKVVICGHVHAEHEWSYQAVSVYSAPSTAVQFCSKHNAGDAEELPIEKNRLESLPGFKLYELWPDGRFQAFTRRLSANAIVC